MDPTGRFRGITKQYSGYLLPNENHVRELRGLAIELSHTDLNIIPDANFETAGVRSCTSWNDSLYVVSRAHLVIFLTKFRSFFQGHPIDPRLHGILTGPGLFGSLSRACGGASGPFGSGFTSCTLLRHTNRYVVHQQTVPVMPALQS